MELEALWTANHRDKAGVIIDWPPAISSHLPLPPQQIDNAVGGRPSSSFSVFSPLPYVFSTTTGYPDWCATFFTKRHLPLTAAFMDVLSSGRGGWHNQWWLLYWMRHFFSGEKKNRKKNTSFYHRQRFYVQIGFAGRDATLFDLTV